MKIYFAGPLFSEAERDWISKVKGRIETLAATQNKGLTVIWPWELFQPGEIESLGCSAPQEIFNRCLAALDECDEVIALLDGPLVDDGTAWEVGYAYSRGKPIIGIRTDIRRAGECENALVNCMIQCSCSHIAKSVHDLLVLLKLEQ